MSPRDMWLERLARLLEQIQPELAPVSLSENTRLGEDLGLDSLAFEELFARLVAALPGKVPTIAWYNALEAGDGRVGILLDLVTGQEAAHA